MSDVLEYYSRYDEDGRLQRSNIHKTEFLTTIHYLDEIIAPVVGTPFGHVRKAERRIG